MKNSRTAVHVAQEYSAVGNTCGSKLKASKEWLTNIQQCATPVEAAPGERKKEFSKSENQLLRGSTCNYSNCQLEAERSLE